MSTHCFIIAVCNTCNVLCLWSNLQYITPEYTDWLVVTLEWKAFRMLKTYRNETIELTIFFYLTPPQKQHGSDLTQLWQCVHTSTCTIHPHLNWVDSETAVNTDRKEKNQTCFKTHQHNCSCITLQQQCCFNKKSKTARFIWHYRSDVKHSAVCAVLLQVKHILCFVRRCTAVVLGLYR